MNKTVKIFSVLLVVFVIVYLSGPRAKSYSPSIKEIKPPLQKVYVEQIVKERESELKIKEGNESRFYWEQGKNIKTRFVLLYLHGFSASPEEGAPVHLEFAKRYGMNMYAPLLAEHGLVEGEAMLHFTAEKYMKSAADALKLAKQMGDSVIIMSTSTGSTAALYLASQNNDIHSLICYSPNIALFDTKSSMLTGPWGLQIARIVNSSKYYTWKTPEAAKQYWHTKYRLEAIVELQRLIEGTMLPETFKKVTVPTFVGYYYKNEIEQDSTVSVSAILRMYEQLGSEKKRKISFPASEKHCIPSKYFGKEVPEVSKETYLFAEEVLRLNSTVPII